MAGGQERDIQSANGCRLAERQDMFVAFAGQARLHQTRGSFRDDDLVVRRDVIAVRMGNKSERLRVPRIEPKILLRQINAALVSNIDHAKIYTLRSERRCPKSASACATHLTGQRQNPRFIAR